MAEARRLLVQEDGSIKQVAMDLGYEDASYFTKAFRRVVGQTPSDYRNGRVGQGSRQWGTDPGMGEIS
jgi:AraC-like DNA-binding protein